MLYMTVENEKKKTVTRVKIIELLFDHIKYDVDTFCF